MTDLCPWALVVRDWSHDKWNSCKQSSWRIYNNRITSWVSWKGYGGAISFPSCDDHLTVSLAASHRMQERITFKKNLKNILKIILFQYVYLIIKYDKNYLDFFHYIECLKKVLQIFSNKSNLNIYAWINKIFFCIFILYFLLK